MTRFKLKSRDFLSSSAGKREFNEKLFSAIAREYTWMSRILSFGRDAAWKKKLLRQIPDLPSSPACLDLACGHGELIRLLYERIPVAAFTGIDLCEPMLAEARDCLPPEINVNLIQGDMTDTHLPDAAFDLVTVGYGLRNAPELEAALDEIERVLTPGGYMAGLDFSRWNNPFAMRFELAVLRLWCSLWGLVRSGNPDTYAYIADSLARFPQRQKLHEMLTAKGFRIVSSRRHCLGVIETFVAQKADYNQPTNEESP
ncbi:MAG: ubiquinone/menaquinone biosynthesis methyltransferase [Lentisphaeria bacterium]